MEIVAVLNCLGSDDKESVSAPIDRTFLFSCFPSLSFFSFKNISLLRLAELADVGPVDLQH